MTRKKLKPRIEDPLKTMARLKRLEDIVHVQAIANHRLADYLEQMRDMLGDHEARLRNMEDDES